MDKKNSIAAGKTGGAAKPNQASATSNCPAGRHRVNIKMVQNVLLIWLDNNINENTTDGQNTLSQLHCAVNTIDTFTDGDECIQFITDT